MLIIMLILIKKYIILFIIIVILLITRNILLQKNIYNFVFGAEQVLEASIDDSTYQHGRATVVFTDDQTGYVFYKDTTGFRYRKTTDGGSTFSAEVTIVSTGYDMLYEIWYDKWTPNDNGTKIHIVYVDEQYDDLKYLNLDTSTDTLSSIVTIINGSIFSNVNQSAVSITKATNGYLFASAGGTGLDKIYKSTDGGSTWSDTVAFSFNNNDAIQLFPLSNGDVIAIVQDSSANNLISYIYSNSSSSWGTGTTINNSINENTSAYVQYGGAVYKSTGDIYLTVVNSVDSSSGDILSYVFSDSSRTWTQKTDCITNALVAQAKTFVDEGTGDIYCIYNKSTSSALFNSDVYYKKSTDGMTTWSTETQINSTYDDNRIIRANLNNNERLFVCWFNDDTNDLYCDTAVDLTPPSGGGILDTQLPTGIINFE